MYTSSSHTDRSCSRRQHASLLHLLFVAWVAMHCGSSRDLVQHNIAKSQRTSSKVPKLLHYIYLGGHNAFMKGSNETAEKAEQFQTMQGYFEGCQKLHRHWDSLFWDRKMARALIKLEYSWFLPVWDSYDSEVCQCFLSLFSSV